MCGEEIHDTYVYTIKYCFNDNIKAVEIGGACGTHGTSCN
jgi:hypothetical protein